MKILIVSQYFWPENFRINDLVAGLTSRGHFVTVLTGLPNYPDGQLYQGYGLFRNQVQQYEGATIIRVPLIPRGKGGGLNLAINYLSFVVSASLFGPFRCRESYDIIFIMGLSPVTVALPALLIKFLRKMPAVMWVQDLWPESLQAAGAVSSPRILQLVGLMVRAIYARCDRILIASRAFSSSITRFVPDKGQIVYFPQYGESLYKKTVPLPGAPERLLVPKGFIVMFAGNIGAAQDFGTILSAAHKLCSYGDIHFVIVGDGRMRSLVEKEVTRLGIGSNFHLLGRHPLETMPSFFALADAMLVTLKKDPVFSLTIPGKIQSYLACGRPIIAALDGEGASVIREASAGFTCPSEDSEALAAAILKMYELPGDDREKMGLQGQAYYAATFDRNVLLDRLESVMHGLVAT